MCEEYETFHDRTVQPVVGGTIKFLTRAKRDQDSSTLGLWWPDQQRSSLANNMENELKSYHNKTNSVNFVWKNMRWNWLRVILQAVQRPKQNHRLESAGSSTRTTPIREWIWTDVEPGEYSISDHVVSKKLIHLRHGRLVHREDEGAIEFWRIKHDHQKHFLPCPHWSDDKWKKSMAGGGGNKKRYVLYLFVRSNLVTPSSSRLFRTQSHWSYFWTKPIRIQIRST